MTPTLTSTPRPARRQAGFTLIEVMVALVVALVLIGAMTRMQLQLGQVTARTKDVESRDDQTRVALDRITQDLSSAGFLFAGLHTPCNALFTYSSTASAVAVRHGVDSVAGSSGTGFALVPALSSNYPTGGVSSDILVVTTTADTTRLSDATTPLVAATPSSTISPLGTGSLPVVSTASLSVGNTVVVQVPDSGKRACLRVPVGAITAGVSFQASTTATTMPSNGYPGFVTTMVGAGFTGPLSDAELFQSRLVDIGTLATANQTYVAYHVEMSTAGYPVLMRRVYSIVDDTQIGAAQAIAAGVISLQVRYGLDPGNTGAVTQYATAAAVATLKAWDTVRSVRVLIVARPLIDDPDPNYTWPASPNVGLAAPFTDFAIPTTPVDFTHRRYSILQTEIAARNLLWR